LSKNSCRPSLVAGSPNEANPSPASKLLIPADQLSQLFKQTGEESLALVKPPPNIVEALLKGQLPQHSHHRLFHFLHYRAWRQGFSLQKQLNQAGHHGCTAPANQFSACHQDKGHIQGSYRVFSVVACARCSSKRGTTSCLAHLRSISRHAVSINFHYNTHGPHSHHVRVALEYFSLQQVPQRTDWDRSLADGDGARWAPVA
jgi:predicted metal-binding protein